MISILCPSRGRPTLAKRMIDTVYNTVSDPKNIEFLLYLNEDDPTLDDYKKYIDKRHYTIGPNQSTCYSWNQLAEKAKFDILFLAGDDIQFMTKNWDLNIIKVFEKFPGRIPVIVERAANAKTIPLIDKNKFLVPADLTLSQFIYVIRKRLVLPPEQALFLFVGNTLSTTSVLMKELYSKHKEEDGFM